MLSYKKHLLHKLHFQGGETLQLLGIITSKVGVKIYKKNIFLLFDMAHNNVIGFVFYHANTKRSVHIDIPSQTSA